MASERNKLSLFIDKVEDTFSRENFLKLRRFIATEPYLAGDWKFFDVPITKEGDFYPVPHNLKFIPRDFVILSKHIGLGGNIRLSPEKQGFFEKYADSRYIYFSVEAPRVSFPGTAVFTTTVGVPISIQITAPVSGNGDVPLVRQNDPVIFIPGENSPGVVLPPELNFNQIYYAKFDGTVNGGPLFFQLSNTAGGASILSGAGTPATLPAGETILCKPTDFSSRVRFIAGAINDI